MKSKLDAVLPSTIEERIQSAMNTLVKRHDTLRATISSCPLSSDMPLSATSTSSHVKLGNVQVVQKVNDLSEIDICSFKRNPMICCRCIRTSDHSLQATEMRCVSCAIREEISTPFDVSKQLFRCAVFNPSDGEVAICLVFHHIITDGMSLFILTSELLALIGDGYSRVERLRATITHSHNHPSLPTLPIGPSQAGIESMSNQKKKFIEKWIGLLSSANKCLDLWGGQHGKHISNAEDPHLAEDVFLELTEKSSKTVEILSQTYRASPAVIIAAFYTLSLHYFTGESDIIIGMVSANRRVALANVVGYFANTLPLRVNLNTPQATDLKLLLKEVRRNWSMILSGSVDLSDLVPLIPCLQHMSSCREVSSVHSSPLQVLFSFYDVGEGRVLPKEFKVEGVEVECEVDVPKPGHTHADLWMEFNPNFWNENRKQVFHWEYRKSILSHSMVEFIHQVLCRYLEAAKDAINAGQECIDPLQLSFQTSDLSLSQAHGNSFSRSGREVQDTSHLCYIQRFEQKANECPLSPAFRLDSGLVYTYSDVKNMITSIALFLVKTHKIGPGDHVALFLPRDVNLYLVVLAILKCGAAYVPVTADTTLLDVEDRLQRTLKVAEAKVLLTLKSMWKNLQKNITGVVYLDKMMANIQQFNGPDLSDADLSTLIDLEAAYSPDLLFYVLFTSGTTGEPKAVGITNGNLDTTFNNFLHLLTPKDTELTLAATGINFDSHVLDSLAPLLNGACLVVANSPLDLVDESKLNMKCDLNDSGVSCMSTGMSSIYEGITFTFSTPSTASVVDFPSSMQAIMVGGELFTKACYLNTEHIPKVLNIYGPTESSVFMTAIEVPKGVALSSKDLCTEEISRIGWPLPQVKVMIMNEAKHVVPIGRIGELHIAGTIVSTQGYLNDGKKTKSSFFPNPYAPAETIYATGDLMYMLPNQMLQFVGRKDGQVKLRGMRINLQEVTNTLSSYTDVKYATSLVINPSTSSAMLVSFVSPKKVDKSLLLKHLRCHLPHHMIPSVIITEDELINYKLSKDYIHKRALQALKEEENSHENVIKDPAILSFASRIAALFGKVLEVQDYPVKGDFFTFGGHSLLCFQLLKEINQEMAVRLSLTHIMQHPTPLDLASVVTEIKSDCNKVHQLATSSSIQSYTEVSGSNQTPNIRPFREVSTGHKVSASEFDYLEPVPNLPLSTGLELKLTQCDESCGHLNSEELLHISKSLAEETGFYIPPSSLTHYSSHLELLQAHLKLKNVLSFTSCQQKIAVTLKPPATSTDEPIFFIHSGVIGWSQLSYVKLARKIGKYSVAIQRTPEATTRSFEEMVAFYLKEMLSIQPKGPYRLVGVCYGAYVVYEMVRQLTDKGERVDLAVLINNSPVNENRPTIFNERGQPLPNTMAHPFYFFKSTLKLAMREDEKLVYKHNIIGAEVDSLTTDIVKMYPWLPFSPRELAEAYCQFINTLKPAWFGYVPKSIKQAKLVRRVILFRNKEHHPFFKSHDYGLLELFNNSESLKVIVSPRKLGLLNEEHTIQFISEKIMQNLIL